MDSVLRPRDIQARIRSGESPETVAAAAQTTVEQIMGFATPVLAERAYVAEQAQKASVRRRSGDGPIGALGQTVAERLAARDIDPETVEWDAWRREDGRWTLVADFGAGQSGGRASFVYDAAGRYVVADDEESRWLVGERHGSESTSAVEAPAQQGRRLSAVGSEQVSLGDDAIEVVTGRRPADVAVPEAPRVSEAPQVPEVAEVTRSPEEPTVDLTEARRVAPSTPPTRVSAEPEALFDAPAAPVVPPRQAEPADSQADSPADYGADSGADSRADVQTADSETGAEPAAAEAAAAEQEPSSSPKQRKPAKGRGRASVPSWDEIMFGSSRGE